jgi:hypothetical protein
MRGRIARRRQSGQAGSACPAKTQGSLRETREHGGVMQRDGCAGGQGLKRYVDVGRCSSGQAIGPAQNRSSLKPRY